MINSLLNLASIYQILQNAIGAPNGMRTLTRQYLIIPPKARVLDVGCGTASFRHYLPESVEYVGIDVNPRYIAKARQNVPDGRFYVIDENPKDFPEKDFDYCLFIGVLHHMSDAVAQNALRLAASSLNDSGMLMALEPVVHENRGNVERLLMKLDRGMFIRTLDQYRILVQSQFQMEQGTILPHLCRIPWTHCLLTAKV